MIALLAEVHGVEGAVTDPLEVVVIETSKGKAGPSASVVVRVGKLAVGETVYSGSTQTKIKALFDSSGKSVKEVFPGKPTLILGFTEVPQVGTKIGDSPVSEQPVKQEQKVGKLASDEIAVFLKAESAGSLEALVHAMPEKVIVIDASVGDVTPSDILSAKSSNALIFVFGAKVPSNVAKLADTEGIRVERFEIIYELIQRLEEILKKGLVQIAGRAEILATFPFNNQKVAGCKVLDGKISKGTTLTLMRGDKEIGKAKAVTMKKLKQEIPAASAGEEFGVILSPQLDFAVGDVLLSAT